jgi:hypothetical protein
MNTTEKQSAAAKVTCVRFTIAASFQLLEKAATGVASRVFFDRQMGFSWMRVVFAHHLFDIFCRPKNFGSRTLLKSKAD